MSHGTFHIMPFFTCYCDGMTCWEANMACKKSLATETNLPKTSSESFQKDKAWKGNQLILTTLKRIVSNHSPCKGCICLITQISYRFKASVVSPEVMTCLLVWSAPYHRAPKP